MIIYLYSKCSTCKNALRFLKEKKVVFTIKEITKEPPSLEELRKMLQVQGGNVKKLFNTSGVLYRKMNLVEKLKDMSIEEVLSLLVEHEMLIKRPFLLGKDFGFTGFNASEWSQKIEQ